MNIVTTQYYTVFTFVIFSSIPHVCHVSACYTQYLSQWIKNDRGIIIQLNKTTGQMDEAQPRIHSSTMKQ